MLIPANAPVYAAVITKAINYVECIHHHQRGTLSPLPTNRFRRLSAIRREGRNLTHPRDSSDINMQQVLQAGYAKALLKRDG